LKLLTAQFGRAVVKTLVLLSFGFVSGVLTCGVAKLAAQPSVSPWWFLCSGIIFAFYLCLYALWGDGVRSLWRIVGFLLVTTAAFWVAAFAGFFGVHGMRELTGIQSMELNGILLGGIVGSAMVALARNYLLLESRVRAGVYWRLALIAFAGGILGVVGFSIGRPKSDRAAFCTMFMTWQTLMAPLLCLVFPGRTQATETTDRVS